ncbi:carboxypeptidase-like regulatory domain-containing protein [Balneola vulgaris]|uniref:carboxypeptidase-like regulatory domain-containing protein n=1 Tax=Balneola vulgaris TaxID=287535 RepID=UPI00035D2417|nr:carboxypeptidase-like regulatory domain-containing protein [Balneola vulgaris]
MFKNKKMPTILTVMLFGLVSIAAVNKENNHPINPTAYILQQQNVLLTGEVVDSETEEALAEVTIKVSELNVSVETNKEGEYSVKNLVAGETYTIIVEHDGYKKYESDIEIDAQSPKVSKTIKLEPEDS